MDDIVRQAIDDDVRLIIHAIAGGNARRVYRLPTAPA